jgi:Ca2+:H+ antiporter
MRALFRVTNLLLIAIPLGIASETMQWGKGLSFLLLAVAIIPLAGLGTTFTDALIIRSNMQLGSVLNSCFSNLSFIILGLVALSQGLGTVVQASVAGALITNTLFVLGATFFMGHVRRQEQIFDKEHARGYAKFLVFILFALVLPTVLQTTSARQQGPLTEFNVYAAFALLAVYTAYVPHDVFHILDTEFHRLRRQGKEQDEAERPDQRIMRLGTLIRSEDSAATAIPRPISLIRLVATALGIIYVSTLLANVTQELTSGAADFTVGPFDLATIRLSQTFVGLVVIPIIGSLAANVNSIRAAMKGKADEAVANTAGWAIQVSLIAVPVFVLCSYFFFSGNPFDLLFTKLEIVIIGLGTFIYYLVVEDGKGTWLEGRILMVGYAIFAVAAYCI